MAPPSRPPRCPRAPLFPSQPPLRAPAVLVARPNNFAPCAAISPRCSMARRTNFPEATPPVLPPLSFSPNTERLLDARVAPELPGLGPPRRSSFSLHYFSWLLHPRATRASHHPISGVPSTERPLCLRPGLALQSSSIEHLKRVSFAYAAHNESRLGDADGRSSSSRSPRRPCAPTPAV